jgi:hypothetical protein
MNRNVTLSIDEELLEKAREKLRATGKTVNQEFREHMERIAGADKDRESAIRAWRERIGKCNSQGWKWNRDDAYEGRLDWPRR